MAAELQRALVCITFEGSEDICRLQSICLELNVSRLFILRGEIARDDVAVCHLDCETNSLKDWSIFQSQGKRCHLSADREVRGHHQDNRGFPVQSADTIVTVTLGCNRMGAALHPVISDCTTEGHKFAATIGDG